MAKSKYTSATVNTILETIRGTGSLSAGWCAGNISRNTFYSWLNKYEDFANKESEKKWGEIEIATNNSPRAIALENQLEFFSPPRRSPFLTDKQRRKKAIALKLLRQVYKNYTFLKIDSSIALHLFFSMRHKKRVGN